jgi:hypothetical protein
MLFGGLRREESHPTHPAKLAATWTPSCVEPIQDLAITDEKLSHETENGLATSCPFFGWKYSCTKGLISLE